MGGVVQVRAGSWRGRRTTAALYRNDGKGSFRDVTAGSGLDVELYGIGVAVGDFDNDGRGDVYVTALEGDRVIRVEQAKHLLATTRRSATQIAADTGFCDLPHLIRVFRAAEGMTPVISR